MLKFNDEASSIFAANALGMIGPEAKEAAPALTEKLFEALLNGNWRVGLAAAQALGRIGPDAKEAVPALLKALGNKYIRVGAAFALTKINSSTADQSISLIIEALNDESSFIRDTAAQALVEIGPAAVSPLIAALKDENLRVRKAAAIALGHIGPDAREAVPALIMALEEGDMELRGIAEKSLEKIQTGE